MDLNSVSKFTKEKSLFSDIVFYVAISLLISSVLCYLIFSIKISSQKEKVKSLEDSMLTIGTAEQKEKEAVIFKYQKKIVDYTKFLNNHKASSNVFAFLESLTLPEVWFSRINLSERENKIILTGESGNMDILSRQISAFEKNEFVKKISILNSSVWDSGKIKFSTTIDLDPILFISNY
jgi:hypothetical protein